MPCRWCQSEKLMSINAMCGDMFYVRLPGEEAQTDSGHNCVPGLMEDDGSGDYIEFDMCMDCQRVQKDLFKQEGKPKRLLSVEQQLFDLHQCTKKLVEAVHVRLWGRGLLRGQVSNDLEPIVKALASVDRCLPGLVRELEKGDK